MNYFAWIIPAEQESLLLTSAGVSSSYVLSPPSGISAKDLVGAIILIILRGNKGDVLLNKIYIKKIDEIIDEETQKPEGKLLLSVDLLRSIRAARSYKSGLSDFIVSESSTYPLGVCKISKSSATLIFSTAESHVQQRFIIPTEKDLCFRDAPIPTSLCASQFAQQLLKMVLKNYSLETTWRSLREKSPFVNFAISHLKHYKDVDNDAVIKFLHDYSENIFSFEKEKASVDAPPSVDIDFESIDPEKITARKFVAIENNNGIVASMLKTEDAEKRHQEILQDISRYFISVGIVPLQSSSIDLAFRNKDLFSIFEIKTTTTDNVVQQAAKGAFQLAIYSHGMGLAGLSVTRRILILEILDNIKLENFISETLRSLNIEVLFYNRKKEWPERLTPLLL